MQKSHIIDAIYTILKDELNIANIAAFSPKARLNEDLYLDSVLVLQLLIGLELKLSIEVPDDAINIKDFSTVECLSHFLHNKIQQQSETEVVAPISTDDEFEDIKVHCFVSCLCESVKKDKRVDHRPFYFGVWDADVVVDENYHINYHSDKLNHDFFRHWFKQLYNVDVTPWYNHQLPKEDNINILLKLLNTKSKSQHVMVMLDMYHLPERENKFNQNPFPHYVMLENSTNQDTLFMWDPDFRWEGEQNKQQVIKAISSKAVAGGYLFDSEQIKPTTNKAISEYFTASLTLSHNPMTDAVRSIIDAHLNHTHPLPPSQLIKALDHLPVLAIRKYAYEHGLAFFLLALELSFDEFDQWCEVIEHLVSTYKQIQFRAMKIAAKSKESQPYDELVVEITQLLDQQDIREFKIKHRLNTLFQQWQKQVELPLTPQSEACL